MISVSGVRNTYEITIIENSPTKMNISIDPANTHGRQVKAYVSILKIEQAVLFTADTLTVLK